MSGKLRSIALAWDRFWFAPASPVPLAVCRVTACLALFSFLLVEPAWTWTSQLGVLGQLPPEFWKPIPVLALLRVGPPTASTVYAVFGLTLTAAVSLLLGLFARVCGPACAAGAFYLLAVRNSWGKIYHDYHVLMVILMVLAVSACGDALALRRQPTAAANGVYRWPVKLIQLSYTLMFFFAAYNKLADGDGVEWVLSENMRNTLLVQNFVHEPAPTLLGPLVAQHRVLWTAGALGIVLAQATAVGLVFIRQRFVRAVIFSLLLGFVAGRTLLMGMPEPIFLILTLVLVDWEGVEAQIRRRFRVSHPARNEHEKERALG
jgi:hypothetical protein